MLDGKGIAFRPLFDGQMYSGQVSNSIVVLKLRKRLFPACPDLSNLVLISRHARHGFVTGHSELGDMRIVPMYI